MNQNEIKESIKETFNVSLENRESLPSKTNSRLKLTIAIISTLLIFAATATLLIGYFKFDWFKNEIYKVDANITREVNQANYFTEIKKINTKIALTKDNYEEQTYEVNTDFMVYLKDRTKLKENDYLNTASLIITKSKMTTKNEEYELPSLDIKDVNKIKELESNPKGLNVPIAYFSFYENGTISDIKFPDSTDEYNVQTLKELVEKVIPKLSRNRTEDNANGLNIKTRKDRKKKTLIEEEKPKQYYSFKGSKFSKSVERDFEDDKLTDIRTISDIHLQSNPEEDEQILGATDFYFKTESYIKTYEFGPGTPAVIIFGSSNPSTNEGLKPSPIIGGPLIPVRILDEQSQSSSDSKPTKPIKINEKTRKLGAYNDISADQTFNIGKYDVLGQTVTVKYHVAVSNGNPINEIIISSNLGTAKIGNTGVSLKGSWGKSQTIFSFVFPSFPLVTLNGIIKGSISWGISATGSGSSVVLTASLSGTLSLGCEVKAGWDPVASFSGGVEGIIVSASGSATIKNKSVTKNFSISAGKIYAYLDRSILGNKERVGEITLFNGW